MARKIIHVHQQKIKKGLPAIIVRTWRGSQHFTKVRIHGESVMIHSPNPDSCGARVWIEVPTDVAVTGFTDGNRTYIK